MAKSIPTKEFRAAVKAFNAVLKSSEDETPIKVVAVKKEKIMEDFTNKILDFIENNKAADLPDEVIDFYNTHIVEDDETPDKPEETADKKKKEKKEKKEKKKTTRKTFFVPNTSGRPKAVGEAIKKGGSQKDIIQRADDIHVANGGVSNLAQTKRLFEHAVRYLYYTDFLTISDNGDLTIK